MIRAALPAGAVSQKELVEMLPFQNEVTIVRLSAAVLFAVLEVSISGLAAVTAVSAPQNETSWPLPPGRRPPFRVVV